MYQSSNSQHQRLKEIQKSNLHVKNLIDNAKKMIYNHNNMSATEKQILQVKISIEKDHLKNTFYKIDCPENKLNLQIVNKNQQRIPSSISKPNTFNETKNTFKLQTTQSYDQKNSNSLQQTKIVISRIVQKGQSSYLTKNQNNPSSLRQSQFSEIYQHKTARTYTIQQPQRNTKIVIKTKEEPFIPLDRFNMTQKIYRPKNTNQYEVKSPSFSSSPKTQRFQIKEQSNVEPYYQQQISLFTPQRTYMIKNTETAQDFNNGSYRIPSGRNMQDIHRNERFNDNSQKYSEKSTSYKEILQKNKEKLQDSRQKHIQTTSKNPSYILNLQKLLDKKEQGKKRLYGQNYESLHKQLNSASGGKVKYSIANSQRKKQDSISMVSGNNTNRDKSQTQRSRQQSLSQQRCKALHSTTIKGIHLPCSSPCPKCKSRISKPKQKQQPLSSYHLAKKYLTPEGEQECYNFLKSQGIEQKDWPIFITQYVYRQLSKTYNQISPHKTQQTN